MTADTDHEAETVVVDASAMVDLLADTDYAAAVAARLRDTVLHAPALLDAEVLSALGRLHRAGKLTVDEVEAGLTGLGTAPVTRHPLPELLSGAWARRDELRLTDALYTELATRLGSPLVTTDHRLARGCPIAEAVNP